MPPKSIQVKKEVIDLSRPTEQFNSLKFQVGGNMESVFNTMKINAEYFTAQSKFFSLLNGKYNCIFDYLLECYAGRRDVTVLNIEVQRTGCDTFESIHYDAVPRECMRLLCVVKERGFSSVDVILQGRNIPISITTDGLYALPPQMSELSISSGNVIEGKRVKACKAIYINFVVKRLSDLPCALVGNEFSRIEVQNGGTKALDKITQVMTEKNKQDLAKGLTELVGTVTGSNAASAAGDKKVDSVASEDKKEE